jgi:dephospho-CoA kinase
MDDRRILVGLGGYAGVGKTITAKNLTGNGNIHVDGQNRVIWDHAFFALPLYELASIRRMIEGIDQLDRQLYETMKLLLNMYRSPLYGGPAFDDLISLAYLTVGLPIEPDQDIKPREFLQATGRNCRNLKEDIFASHIEALFKKRSIEFMNQYEDHDYIMLISDLRYPNEAEMIQRQENGYVIKFEASEEVRAARLEKRDGFQMTKEQMAHESEVGVSSMPYDVTLDTDNLSIEDQVLDTRSLIMAQFNLQDHTQKVLNAH